MKPIKYLTALLLMLSVSWTASSQITGLSQEQKVQIVSAIESYEAVKIELDLTHSLLSECNALLDMYKRRLTIKDKMILNLENQISNYKSMSETYELQIKKERRKNWILGGSGVLLLVIGIVVN